MIRRRIGVKGLRSLAGVLASKKGKGLSFSQIRKGAAAAARKEFLEQKEDIALSKIAHIRDVEDAKRLSVADTFDKEAADLRKRTKSHKQTPSEILLRQGRKER